MSAISSNSSPSHSCSSESCQEDKDDEVYENIKKAKKEAERHAEIDELLCSKKSVSAYDLYQITKELACMTGVNQDDVKENRSVSDSQL